MTKSIQTLLDDNALLRQLLLEQQALLESKDSKILELNQSYQTLLEQFRLAQHHRFGRSSEVCELQGELFNEAETMAEDDTLAVDTIPESETTPPQTKEKPKRKPLPKHLPLATCHVFKCSMTLMKQTRSVIVAVISFKKWARISVKNWSSSPLKSES